MVLSSHIFMLKNMLQSSTWVHCSLAAISPQGALRNLAYHLLFCLPELYFGFYTAARRNVVLLMKEVSMLLSTWTVQQRCLSESALNRQISTI